VKMLHEIDPKPLRQLPDEYAGAPCTQFSVSVQGLAQTVDSSHPKATEILADRRAQGRASSCLCPFDRPTKPVLWAEYGQSAWSLDGDTPPAERQGKFIHDYYEMSRQGGADGLFVWYYPVAIEPRAQRYGIINPDGTDRPATVAIRNESPLFSPSQPSAPSQWLSYDRFAHEDDVHGIIANLEPVLGARAGRNKVDCVRHLRAKTVIVRIRFSMLRGRSMLPDTKFPPAYSLMTTILSSDRRVELAGSDGTFGFE